MYTKPPRDPIKYVDWLRNHMSVNLGDDLSRPLVWHFMLRPRNVSMMLDLAAEFEIDGYIVHTQDCVIETTQSADGKFRDSIGPPMLSLFIKGVFMAEDLKTHTRKLMKIAKAKRIVYEKLDSMSLSEYKMIYGPPTLSSLKDATWQLRHFTSTGLRAGAKIRYRFGIKTKQRKLVIAALTESMKAAIKAKKARVQAASEWATWDVEVIVMGKNDPKVLKSAFESVEAAAKHARVKVKGVLL
jgi:hypothetical protein